MKNDEYLLQIGIAYYNTKKKSRKKKLHYHTEATFDDQVYKYHQNGYKLLSIQGHKLVYDSDMIFKDYHKEKLWSDAINIPEVQNHIKSKKDKDEDKDKDDDDDEDLPQMHFGYLKFECKWDDWPVTTLERWEIIMNTKAFNSYCETKGWDSKLELYATIQEHSQEKFKKILYNIKSF